MLQRATVGHRLATTTAPSHETAQEAVRQSGMEDTNRVLKVLAVHSIVTWPDWHSVLGSYSFKQLALLADYLCS